VGGHRPDGRQALATAIFARTDVMGFERLEYELTLEAIELGLDAALPAMFELTGTIGESGRGERCSTSMSDGRQMVHFVRRTPDVVGEQTAQARPLPHRASLMRPRHSDGGGGRLASSSSPTRLVEQCLKARITSGLVCVSGNSGTGTASAKNGARGAESR
jgi:hypothetical protein